MRAWGRELGGGVRYSGLDKSVLNLIKVGKSKKLLDKVVVMCYTKRIRRCRMFKWLKKILFGSKSSETEAKVNDVNSAMRRLGKDDKVIEKVLDEFISVTSSKYFNVKKYKSMNGKVLNGVVRKLTKFNVGMKVASDEKSMILMGRVLLRDLDKLYLAVSDILAVHMYKNKITVSFVKDKKAVKRLIKKHMGVDVDVAAFYDYEKRTIHISCEDMTASMLGHEIAHAIISKYFVVPPNGTIQEILCGYVDYKIKKM